MIPTKSKDLLGWQNLVVVIIPFDLDLYIAGIFWEGDVNCDGASAALNRSRRSTLAFFFLGLRLSLGVFLLVFSGCLLALIHPAGRQLVALARRALEDVVDVALAWCIVPILLIQHSPSAALQRLKRLRRECPYRGKHANVAAKNSSAREESLQGLLPASGGNNYQEKLVSSARHSVSRDPVPIRERKKNRGPLLAYSAAASSAASRPWTFSSSPSAFFTRYQPPPTSSMSPLSSLSLSSSSGDSAAAS